MSNRQRSVMKETNNPKIKIGEIQVTREDDSFVNESGEYEDGLFIEATVELYLEYAHDSRGRPCYTTQRIHSGGSIVNVETEYRKESYLKEIEQEQIEQLKDQLAILGVNA
jgi:hypothetical protein